MAWLDHNEEVIAFICNDIICTHNYVLRYNGEVFTMLAEAKVLIEQWRREYNQVRLYSSLGYRPPAPEARIPVTLT